MMHQPDGPKYLTAERLIELLQTLPPDADVMVNVVGNLWFDHETRSGWIDFRDAGEVNDKE